MVKHELNTQPIIYNPQTNLCQAAINSIREVLKAGSPITPASLKAPERESYKIVNIEDDKYGVTYESLFGSYLAEASHIRISDPYVRQEYQVRNVENLINVAGLKHGSRVDLVTMFEKNDKYGFSAEDESRERLDALKKRLAQKGVEFSYSFDPQLHDRGIETDKWQIILGRGLDFYYPPDSTGSHSPESRRAKKCRIVFIPR